MKSKTYGQFFAFSHGRDQFEMKLSTDISVARCFFEEDPYSRLLFDVFMEVARKPIYAASSEIHRSFRNMYNVEKFFDYNTKVVLAELVSIPDCTIMLASTLSGESLLSQSEHHSYNMGIGFCQQQVKIEDMKYHEKLKVGNGEREINFNLGAQIYFKTNRNNEKIKTCLDRNRRFFRNERRRLFPYAAWLLEHVEKARSDRNLV